MAKPNYQLEKRMKEMKRQRKQEEKMRRKLEKKGVPPAEGQPQ